MIYYRCREPKVVPPILLTGRVFFFLAKTGTDCEIPHICGKNIRPTQKYNMSQYDFNSSKEYMHARQFRPLDYEMIVTFAGDRSKFRGNCIH